GKLNNNQAKEVVFNALLNNPDKEVLAIVTELDILVNSDASEIEKLIDEVVNKFPDKVKEYNTGKKGVLGLFMGELMKISKGKIDPKKANKVLIEKIESLK